MSRLEKTDNPGVIAFPPLIGLVVVLLGLLFDYFLALGFVERIDFVPRASIGACLLALGMSMAATARATFLAAGTNVNPIQPALAMVTTGIFSHVRNPMYEGGTLMLIGIALLVGSDWILILLVPALLLVHFGVVLREERYLSTKFGEVWVCSSLVMVTRLVGDPQNCGSTRQQKQIHMGDETAPSLTVWRATKGRRPKPTPRNVSNLELLT